VFAVAVAAFALATGVSGAYFPANIVAGSYYANIITNFSGFGLTTANITVLTAINTTRPYDFQLNESVNGAPLNCTSLAPFYNTTDKATNYFCFGYDRTIRHNTILNLYGLAGQARNILVQNLSLLAVTPQHPYNITTVVVLDGNVVLNESVTTKVVNITNYASSGKKNTVISNASVSCGDITPVYVTGNLSISIVPYLCFYNNSILMSANSINQTINESVLTNFNLGRVINDTTLYGMKVDIYEPDFTAMGISMPGGYGQFYAVGTDVSSTNSLLHYYYVLVNATYPCFAPQGPLSAVSLYKNSDNATITVPLQLSISSENGNLCRATFMFYDGQNVSILYRIPSRGSSSTSTTTSTTTAPTTTVQQHNNPSSSTTVSTTTSVSTTVTTTVPPATITVPPTNNTAAHKAKEKKVRDTAAVTIAVSAASTASIGSLRRFGRH